MRDYIVPLSVLCGETNVAFANLRHRMNDTRYMNLDFISSVPMRSQRNTIVTSHNRIPTSSKSLSNLVFQSHSNIYPDLIP